MRRAFRHATAIVGGRAAHWCRCLVALRELARPPRDERSIEAFAQIQRARGRHRARAAARVTSAIARTARSARRPATSALREAASAVRRSRARSPTATRCTRCAQAERTAQRRCADTGRHGSCSDERLAHLIERAEAAMRGRRRRRASSSLPHSARRPCSTRSDGARCSRRSGRRVLLGRGDLPRAHERIRSTRSRCCCACSRSRLRCARCSRSGCCCAARCASSRGSRATSWRCATRGSCCARRAPTSPARSEDIVDDPRARGLAGARRRGAGPTSMLITRPVERAAVPGDAAAVRAHGRRAGRAADALARRDPAEPRRRRRRSQAGRAAEQAVRRGRGGRARRRASR